MNREKFRRKVEKTLEQLDIRQVRLFAWRCAMRALPFLGSKGHFNYWPEKDRRLNIYRIFNALDVCAANATYAAAKAATYASSAANSAYATYATYATAKAAVNAAKATNSATNAAAYATAAYANATNAAASIAANAATKKNIDLESMFLNDLNTIQGKQSEKQYQLTDLYGEVWDYFQKALENEGCGYWGELYQGIFENGIVLDQEALERRINVPKEIRNQGAAEVANYLEALEMQGAVRLNEARIIILGDKGAGKTCIARRLIDPKAPMTTNAESTAGVDTTLWPLKDENINVRIWDFAGHTVTHAVHQFFLSERCLYIMVYDGRTEERNRLEYWLNHMKNYGGDSQAIILVNKRDQHSVDIKINTLKENYPIAGIYTFSVQDDKKELEAFRNNVASHIKTNPSWENQEIPLNYYQVKEELEKLFDKGDENKGREHIGLEEFHKIAKKHEVSKVDELLKALHFLGVSLWYSGMDEIDTLVLNPEWISHGVYKIINWVNEEKKYALTLDDFEAVFKKDVNRYPKDKYPFLFELMKHYELAYETKEEKKLIIPHLLREDRPDVLPDFPVGESLMLRYKAEQPLPPNTISRFIVRHNQQIKIEKGKYLVWRHGIVLKDNKGSIALVREEDREITVSVRGKNKTNYISTLRKTLNDIFNSYKSDKPELQYRIERYGEIPDEVELKHPVWLPDSMILNQSKDSIPFYEYITKQQINLKQTVNNYDIKTENLMLGGQANQLIADKSTHTTFNFNDCNIGLQGDLNDLAQSLTQAGNKIEAKELQDAAIALEQAENCKSPKEIKKKGIAKRLGRLLKELEDEDSKLHKTVKGIKNGIDMAQDIAKGYNDIAQWAGLPQVPKPFLKK